MSSIGENIYKIFGFCPEVKTYSTSKKIFLTYSRKNLCKTTKETYIKVVVNYLFSN